VRIQVTQDAVAPDKSAEISALLDLAYEGDFSAEDWDHSLGGSRFLGYLDSELIAHGVIVTRRIWLNEIEYQVGYLEAIAVLPKYQRHGYGSKLLTRLTEYAKANYSVSMLSTDEKEFYRRFGWLDFSGESYVLTNGELVRSADEDAGLMWLPGANSDLVELTKAVCEARSGDAW
jgi:aminoglycoside 2'-N-acetyltransferase I